MRDAGDRISCPCLTLRCHLFINVLHMTALMKQWRDANPDCEVVPITGATWYDNLSLTEQELYDMIEDRCPEFTKLNGELCQEFMDTLSDYGIKTADDFESAYFTQFEYAHDESHYGEFVEYCVTEIDCKELPEFLVIDWQASWYQNYRHDFITIEFDGEVYFFFAHF